MRSDIRFIPAIGGLFAAIGWIVIMYFVFFSGDDGDDKGSFFDFLNYEAEPVADNSYDTCVEELASKQYDNESIEQLCRVREANK